MEAASDAMTRQGATLNSVWKGAVTKFGRGPYRLGHGTTHDAGLNILGEGRFLPSLEGKCGSGVYGFMVANSDGAERKLPDVSESRS